MRLCPADSALAGRDHKYFLVASRTVVESCGRGPRVPPQNEAVSNAPRGTFQALGPSIFGHPVPVLLVDLRGPSVADGPPALAGRGSVPLAFADSGPPTDASKSG